MRDDTLLDLASAEPTTVEDLKKIRGVSDKLAEGKIGKEIIRAVNLGLATPKDQIVVTKRRPALTDEETAKLSLLVNASASKPPKGTAARMLASSQDLEELARTPLDLWQEKDIPCLSGWRKGCTATRPRHWFKESCGLALKTAACKSATHHSRTRLQLQRLLDKGTVTGRRSANANEFTTATAL